MTTMWWKEGQDRLQPQDLETLQFDPPRGLHRGFDPDSVREVLTSVRGEWERLLSQYATVWRRKEDLEDIVLKTYDGTQPVVFGEQDAHRRLVWLFATGQQQVEQQLADTDEYCDRLTSEAEQQRLQILSAAVAQRDQIIAEAAERGRRAAENARAAGVPPAQTDAQRIELAAQLASNNAVIGVLTAHLETMATSVLEVVGHLRDRDKATARAVTRNATGTGGQL